MLLLDRFVVKIFMKVLVITITTVVAIFIFSQMIEKSFQINIPASTIIKYYLLQAPWAVVQFFPFASLIASLVSLNLLNRKSELIAMLSSGYSLMRLSVIWGILMIFNCVLLFAVADRILPIANREKNIIKTQEIDKKKNFHSEIKEDRIWYKSDDYFFSVVKFVSEENKLMNIEVYKLNDDFQFTEFFKAAYAQFENSKWVLHNVRHITITDKKSYPKVENLETLDFSIKEQPNDFSDAQVQIENLNFSQTMKFLKRNERLGIRTFAEWTDFHHRIALLVSPLIFFLVGIPFGMTQKRRANLAANITKCLLVILMYMASEQVLMLLGKIGKLPPIIAGWGTVSIFFFVALFLVARKKAW